MTRRWRGPPPAATVRDGAQVPERLPTRNCDHVPARRKVLACGGSPRDWDSQTVVVCTLWSPRR
ncbi:MAG: hypothetical protein NTY67_10270 [Cyanobacteria bacterium]|nr:hypothetical protein [Cyanobacteriota bacterium]